MGLGTVYVRSLLHAVTLTGAVSGTGAVFDSRETEILPRLLDSATFKLVYESPRGKIDWKYYAPSDALSREPLDCSLRWYQRHPNELCTTSHFQSEFNEDGGSETVVLEDNAVDSGTSTEVYSARTYKTAGADSYSGIAHHAFTRSTPMHIASECDDLGAIEWWLHIRASPLKSPLHSIVDPLYWITVQQRKPIIVDAQSDICTGGYVRIMKRGRLIDSEFGFDYLFSYLKGYSRVARVDVDQIDTMSWCYATQDKNDKQACAEEVLAKFPQLGVTHIVVHVCDFQSLEYLCSSAVMYGNQLALMGVVQVQLTTFEELKSTSQGQCIDPFVGIKNIYVSKGSRPMVVLPA
ncbi:hypothetical protein SARC_13270 [Sphaeroforma arctica JP610]|uniref:Uncharacterized protein n=1 Tax=Sphaeroforma arctica JP610 TaxID=667725 RepID=A0A0L0FBQ1_9EUKA|nr:hypothetical protein SARC_13270 [Sphaeroforma arctica JP610]KNC74175.1 hypothetical protein SARC_13270 [Sphaeroforma arctica JP610]|eukprot:XP_014148077.1 hypothetical protein SARC_13270 [Sphaeroforma arctica JP610]